MRGQIGAVGKQHAEGDLLPEQGWCQKRYVA